MVQVMPLPPPLSFASLKFRMVLPKVWYWLIHVVLENEAVKWVNKLCGVLMLESRGKESNIPGIRSQVVDEEMMRLMSHFPLLGSVLWMSFSALKVICNGFSQN